MIEYLVREAERITDTILPNFATKEEFDLWRSEKQQQFHKMIGIDHYLQKKRTPLNVKVTGTLTRDTYRVEKLYFESLPDMYVAGNLYIPNDITSPRPGMVYVCGHNAKQKINYQDHARKFAQMGFVILILDTIQLGEVGGVHHGTHSYGEFQWISQGYTSVGSEVWNAIRGVDLLCSLDEVDEQRIGMTGTSGGGSISWWTACADDRIQVTSPSCGTGTIASHVREQTIDRHCDCIFPSNPYGWSLIEMCALVAPRPLLIVTPDRDEYFEIDSVRYVYERLNSFYKTLDAENNIEFMEFHGPHSYSAESRIAIFKWFVRHLGRSSLQEEDVTDIDGIREKDEDLLVFNGKLPANDESTSVQDWFIPLPEKSEIENETDLKREKDLLIKNLKKESFTAFPKSAPDLQTKVEQRSLNKQQQWFDSFSYVTEQEWRLSGEIRGHENSVYKPSPVVISLKSPGENQELKRDPLLRGLDESWLKCRIDTRGTGKTSWGPELNWFVRRSAALTGRTVASMRVWDTLRGVEAVRSFPYVDSNKVVLAAREDMAVVALYAALLDGNIDTVILHDPPGTQNTPDKSNGTALEIINALRYTDLPHLAGMLWPTKIIFVGQRPESYRWTEKLYRHFGEPGGIWRVRNMEDWKGFLN